MTFIALSPGNVTRVGACGVKLPYALTKVVAAPYLVALNVNLQNGTGRSDAARYH